MELNPTTLAREAGAWDSEKAPKCGNFFVTRGRANNRASAVAQRASDSFVAIVVVRGLGKGRLQASQKNQSTRLLGVLGGRVVLSKKGRWYQPFGVPLDGIALDEEAA